MADTESGLRPQPHPEQPDIVFVLRLYVSGASVKSLEAIGNVQRMCHENPAWQCELDVIDIWQQPGRTERDRVVALPLLIRDQPLPVRRFTGALGDRARLKRVFVPGESGGQDVVDEAP